MKTAAIYIAKADRKLIRFTRCPVKKKHIRLFCRNLSLSDECFIALAKYFGPKTMRNTVLLALAAIKSDDFTCFLIKSFCITVRTWTAEEKTIYEIDTDGRTIIQVTESSCGHSIWEVQYVNPIVLSDEYAEDKYLEAVLVACSIAEDHWIKKEYRNRPAPKSALQ